MLKVLIVDDEKSIREGMNYIIEWEEYGYEIIGTAKNGVEALEMMKEFLPHVVITDIQMPDMSGLELIEKAKELFSDSKFIILSGYDDFKYAKKAIDLNAKRYLLKPIEENELISVLVQLREEFHNLSMSKKQILYNYLHQATNNSYQGDEEFNEDGTVQSEVSGCFHYLMVELDEDETMFKVTKNNHWADDVMPTMFCCISNFIGEEQNHCIIKEGVKGYGIAVNEYLLKSYHQNIKRFAIKLQQEIQDNANLKVSLMIGKKVKSVNDIYQSKVSIELCRKHQFYKGGGMILFYDELQNEEFHNSLINIDIIEQLLRAVKKGSVNDIDAISNKFCEMLKQEKIIPDMAKMYIDNIVMDMIKMISDMGGNISKITSKYSLFKRINGVTINLLNLFLKDLCIEVSQDFFWQLKKKDMGVIGEILDYMQEHYQEDIDLQYISKLFYMNASYLGQLFKKKMGVAYNTYLHQLRIEAAKELIQRGEQKIYLIAQSVGYKDSNYFCIKFEEYEHISPSKFREEFINKKP